MRRLILFFLLFSSLFGDSLEESLAAHIQYSDTEPNYVGHIYIGDHQNQISQGTFVYVKEAVDEFMEKHNPIFLILELDTPGGQVFAAQKISDLLKELDTQHGIPVVAVIDNWAISAGAMLAYSCRYIATVKDGTMGAAAPVTQTGEATSEKVNSAIRTDFGSRAAFFDRNSLIAEAMVDADLFLVWRHGEVVAIENKDQVESGDVIITKKDKLLTLNAKQMQEFDVADLYLPPEKLAPITKAEKTKGQWPATKSLLFQAPFFNEIPNATIISYQMDWKTRFFTILSSPIVTSILTLGLMLCFYIEISTPGFGVPGALGLVCLFLILMSSFAIQAATWLEFLLLGAGIGLILLEIFVIPGFGIVGILGIILAVIGLGAILLPGIGQISFDFDTQSFNAAGQFVLERLAWLGVTFVIGVIIIAILAKFLLPKVRLFSPLILRGEQDKSRGFVAGTAREEMPDVGANGIVISPLRPAGRVEIDGELYDAMSSGRFLEKGTTVRVVQVEGSKLVVEDRSI